MSKFDLFIEKDSEDVFLFIDPDEPSSKRTLDYIKLLKKKDESVKEEPQLRRISLDEEVT